MAIVNRSHLGDSCLFVYSAQIYSFIVHDKREEKVEKSLIFGVILPPPALQLFSNVGPQVRARTATWGPQTSSELNADSLSRHGNWNFKIAQSFGARRDLILSVRICETSSFSEISKNADWNLQLKCLGLPTLPVKTLTDSWDFISTGTRREIRYPQR